MTEGYREPYEQEISAEAFTAVMREAIQLASNGKDLTYEEESRWFDNEDFGDIDQNYVVGRISSDLTTYMEADLWVQAKVYNESINTLTGKHALGFIYIDVEDKERESIFCLKYRLYNDGSITKHYFRDQYLADSPTDVAAAKSFLKELGMDPSIADQFHDWDDKQDLTTKEVQQLVRFLSSVRD